MSKYMSVCIFVYIKHIGTDSSVGIARGKVGVGIGGGGQSGDK